MWAKLPVYRVIYGPTLVHSHKLWVVTKRTRLRKKRQKRASFQPWRQSAALSYLGEAATQKGFGLGSFLGATWVCPTRSSLGTPRLLLGLGPRPEFALGPRPRCMMLQHRRQAVCVNSFNLLCSTHTNTNVVRCFTRLGPLFFSSNTSIV